MSNHIVASHVTFVKLIYKNKVHTLVACAEYNPTYVKELILKAIKSYEEQKNRTQAEGYIGVVWKIDCLLNMEGLYQMFATCQDSSQQPQVVNVGYNYDCGENETEEEVSYITKEEILYNSNYMYDD